MKKSKMIPFEMKGTKRDLLLYELGQCEQLIFEVDKHDDKLDLDNEKFLRGCFKLWFGYYGVGE